MKKSVIFLVTLCMLLIAMTIPAQAVETSGSCGANITWTLDGSGTLRLSGSGAMTDFIGADGYYSYGCGLRPWYESSLNIRKIVIGSGITHIGDYAFCDSAYLNEVSIPSTVTSIGKEAFANCEALQNISLPSGLTSLGIGTFFNCGIRSINIPNGITELPENVFYDCVSLNSISWPSHLKTIGIQALGSTGFTSLSIPDTVTTIENSAFYFCTQLTDITLPSGLSRIAINTFDNSGIRSITIPASVKTIERAFQRCWNLSTVYFQGSAPSFPDSNTFSDDTLTAYYPAGDSTWTSSVMQDHGGSITWKSYSGSAPSGGTETQTAPKETESTPASQESVSTGTGTTSAPQETVPMGENDPAAKDPQGVPKTEKEADTGLKKLFGGKNEKTAGKEESAVTQSTTAEAKDIGKKGNGLLWLATGAVVVVAGLVGAVLLLRQQNKRRHERRRAAVQQKNGGKRLQK